LRLKVRDNDSKRLRDDDELTLGLTDGVALTDDVSLTVRLSDGDSKTVPLREGVGVRSVDCDREGELLGVPAELRV
jgi:hypothetical protein